MSLPGRVLFDQLPAASSEFWNKRRNSAKNTVREKNLAIPTKFFISFDLMSLDAPDELHLRAAGAYIELGMFDEAQAELE